MREIKFRAWSHNSKVMSPGASLETWLLQHMIEPEFDGIVWMQYTGLKDKNGREIFEGDILVRHSGYSVTDPLGPVIWSDIVPEFVIDRNQAGSSGYYELSTAEAMNMLEVIGNIYGNPELLK